jgi:hypothetical protein
MAVRVDGWKMHIGMKPDGLWWGEKYYPSVPYLFNLLMDPMEKMDPESHEWGYIGRKFFAEKLWAPTAAGRAVYQTGPAIRRFLLADIKAIVGQQWFRLGRNRIAYLHVT